MAWSDVWKEVKSWPAAITAGLKAVWPELRLAVAGIAGAFIDQLRQERKAAVERLEESDSFAAHQRQLRLNPDSRERLRRESGKPPQD